MNIEVSEDSDIEWEKIKEWSRAKVQRRKDKEIVSHPSTISRSYGAGRDHGDHRVCY